MRKYFIITILIGATFSGCALLKHKTKRKYEVGKEYTTPSGLKFKLLSEGNGEKADSGDIVEVNYTGKLTNDTVFDSSYKRDKPFTFKLGEGHVIKGWDEGIAMMNVGDKAELTIPANLGYGERAVGPIPANSTLIFDVELLKVTKPPKPFDVKGKDTLSTADGLKYIMVKSNPDGTPVQKGDSVEVHYTGYFTNGKIFDSSYNRGEPLKFKVGMGQVIKGWDEGLMLLKKGEKARLLVPYQLAYGEKGYPGAIPPKSDLIFDVYIVGIQGK